jgi:hypothetical protein
MRNGLVQKILKIDNHRNGVFGAPFDVVLFQHDNRKMIAILFEGKYQCAVLDVQMLSKDNIEFAMGNSWRGDDFDAELRPLVKEYWDNYNPNYTTLLD